MNDNFTVRNSEIISFDFTEKSLQVIGKYKRNLHVYQQRGSRFRINLKLKGYLKFKIENIILKQSIFKLYEETRILHDPTNSAFAIVMRNKIRSFVS